MLIFFSKAKLPGKYTSAQGLFCYVSGSALCSCRDVQVSKSTTDSYGRPRYYSFEACTTPPRNQCSNYGLNNYGDGDFQYCQGTINWTRLLRRWISNRLNITHLSGRNL